MRQTFFPLVTSQTQGWFASLKLTEYSANSPAAKQHRATPTLTQGEYDRCFLLSLVAQCAFACADNGFEPRGEVTQAPPSHSHQLCCQTHLNDPGFTTGLCWAQPSGVCCGTTPLPQHSCCLLTPRSPQWCGWVVATGLLRQEAECRGQGEQCG